MKCESDKHCQIGERCETGNFTCVPVICDLRDVRHGVIKPQPLISKRSFSVRCDAGYVLKRSNATLKSTNIECKYDNEDGRVGWYFEGLELKPENEVKCLKGCVFEDDCSSFYGHFCESAISKCQPKPCPGLRMENIVGKVGPLHVVNDTVTITCKRGYVQRGSKAKEIEATCVIDENDEPVWRERDAPGVIGPCVEGCYDCNDCELDENCHLHACELPICHGEPSERYRFDRSRVALGGSSLLKANPGFIIWSNDSVDASTSSNVKCVTENPRSDGRCGTVVAKWDLPKIAEGCTEANEKESCGNWQFCSDNKCEDRQCSFVDGMGEIVNRSVISFVSGETSGQAGDLACEKSSFIKQGRRAVTVEGTKLRKLPVVCKYIEDSGTGSVRPEWVDDRKHVPTKCDKECYYDEDCPVEDGFGFCIENR